MAKISIDWPHPFVGATIECPKLRRGVPVRDCWAVVTVVDEAGKQNTDFACEFFESVIIGSIDCSFSEPDPEL